VAGFGTTVGRPIYGRGPSPGLRFTIYALLALVLMYLDQRARWSERIRYALEAAAYPVQVAVNSPAATWHWLTDSFATRNTLRAQNLQLQQRLRELELTQLRQQALERENLQLRELHAALPPLAKRWQIAEVIGVEAVLLRQRLIINKGAHAGVHVNQPVVDGTGVLGQVVHVGPWSSEVILITDPEHALPVQIMRNDLRTIAVGSGSADELLLPYLAINSDVKSGDVLVSSGLGGVFPAGYPVARVIGVRREANQLLAQVRAEPLGHIAAAREVMLLDFDPAHPAAPPSAAALADAAEPLALPPKAGAASDDAAAARKPGNAAKGGAAARRKAAGASPAPPTPAASAAPAKAGQP
jgi:rod shape-determining protein MreC